MSAAASGSPRSLPRPARRLLAATLAFAAAAGLIAFVGLVLSGAAPAPPPARNPFGTGLREAAPAAGGLGGWILAVQAEFYRSLTVALAAMKRDGGAIGSLAAIGFLYGAFHAAGPGHGKAVIAGYLVATRRTLAKGLGLSFAAALLQAGVAIALVGIMALVLRAGSASINAAAATIEVASFALLLVVGLALLWRKTAAVVPTASPLSGHRGHHHDHGDHAGPRHHHADGEACAHCGHAHAPPPEAIERLSGLRESAAIVLAAGIRPCSGAIILLVFALSQGMLAAGIAATFAMALGTALTTGALAALAVLAKGAALRLAGGRGEGGAMAIRWLEVLAAAFVAALGAALLLGFWSAGLAS